MKDPIISYNVYTIHINNTLYSCGHLLILNYVTRRGKTLTVEYHTCQYLNHIIASNGMLYILCTSHTINNRKLIIIDRYYNRTTEIPLNDCDTLLEKDGYIILDGNIIYCIRDRELISSRINREY